MARTGVAPTARAEQHHRPLSGLQDEASARRTDFEDIACLDEVLQIVSSGSIRLDLHTDPIALGRLRAGERVAANERRTIGARKAQDSVLAGQRQRQWLAIRMLQGKRDDVHGLPIDRRNHVRKKSRRGRMSSGCRSKTCIAAPSRACRLALKQCFKRRAPSRRECPDPQSALQPITAGDRRSRAAR
ncbi:hypothetical protein ACVWW4_001967 [Bradyrhizobium sp. LB7.1]